MQYLGYSELTKRLYFLPTSKKQAKIDITEDVKQYIEFIRDKPESPSTELQQAQERIKELEEALKQCESYLNSFIMFWKEGEEVLSIVIKTALNPKP